MTSHRTRARERADEIDISPTKLIAEIERLTADLATANEAGEGYLAALQRERAEFLNYKRRTESEREATLGLASEILLAKVLSIADDFDRALEALPVELREAAWVDGIVAIDRKLRQLLESEGVRPIEALGQPFDPREHEAISRIPSDRPENEVVAELRRGYRIRDRVLRPVLVAVSNGDGAPGGAAPPPGGSAPPPGGASPSAPSPDQTQNPNQRPN
jgi:molecular chaperone GrpE